MRSELFSAENLEKESAQPGMRLQNSKMLKIELNGEAMARVGSMVAYQGQVQFQALGSGGLGKFLKQKLTGEGVPLMKVTGQGDVFLADVGQGRAHHRPGAGRRPLHQRRAACSPSTPPSSTTSRWSAAQGMASVVRPVQLRLQRPRPDRHHHQGHPGRAATWTHPTYVDPQAAVCWSASLQTGYHRAEQLGLGTLLGRTHR